MNLGGEFPTLDGTGLMFVYGKRSEFAKADGTPLDQWKKGWYPATNGSALGYMYTFSWSFKHPYTQDQVDKMDGSKKASLGLSKATGKVFYRLQFSDGSKGVIRNVSVGEVGKGTVTIYSKKDLSAVCLRFLAITGGQGVTFFPDGCNPKDVMGTIKVMRSSLVGDVYSPPPVEGNTNYDIDANGNIVPIGGDDGSSVNSDGEGSGGGDYGGYV